MTNCGPQVKMNLLIPGLCANEMDSVWSLQPSEHHIQIQECLLPLQTHFTLTDTHTSPKGLSSVSKEPPMLPQTHPQLYTNTAQVTAD